MTANGSNPTTTKSKRALSVVALVRAVVEELDPQSPIESALARDIGQLVASQPAAASYWLQCRFRSRSYDSSTGSRPVGPAPSPNGIREGEILLAEGQVMKALKTLAMRITVTRVAFAVDRVGVVNPIYRRLAATAPTGSKGGAR